MRLPLFCGAFLLIDESVGMAISTEDTLPKVLSRNRERWGNTRVAMRQKRFGIWQTSSWEDYYRHVKRLFYGLVSLGVKPGEKVAIIGDNAPELYWTLLATQAIGSISVCIFTDASPDEVRYIVDHSDSKIVVAKDQEQVDKLLSIAPELHKVEKLVYWDNKGLKGYDDPLLMSFDELMTLAQEAEAKSPSLFEESVARGQGNSVSAIMYTSGTSGLPKGVMHTPNALLNCSRAWLSTENWSEDDEVFSFIPPAWSTEQLFMAASLLWATRVSFPEKPETAQENIREISPTIMMYSSRLWDGIASTIQAKIADTSFLKRITYRLLFPVGYRMASYRFQNKKPNVLFRILYGFAYLALFRPLRDRHGLGRVKCAYTGGGAMSPDCFKFFTALGINLKNQYGLTEVLIITAQKEGDIKFESVGTKLMDGVEVTPDGEIIAKAGSTFVGYYKGTEQTAEVMKDGWFHTGDAGYFDDDRHLIYWDRLKDLRQLASGKRFSPLYIEGRLRFSHYIEDVIAVGNDDDEYVVALVTIDFANVGKWAEKRHVPYTTFVDLSQKEEVRSMIRGEIERVNNTLPDWSAVRKFVNLHKAFDPDEAELTRTRKLRRSFVEERYGNLVDAIYRGDKEIPVEAEITYRDGRKGSIKAALRVTTV